MGSQGGRSIINTQGQIMTDIRHTLYIGGRANIYLYV